MKIRCYCLLLSFAFIASQSFAKTEVSNPKTWMPEVHGPLTQVLVLGTPHLSGYGEKFNPDIIDPVLQRLEKFAPDVITIEALSGQQCDYIRRYESEFPGVFNNYCWDNQAVLQASGLTQPQAVAKASGILKKWQATADASPTPAQRRELAAAFLAANDRYSAQVQWLKLPEQERKADSHIKPAMFEVLNRKPKRYNENSVIGVYLAVKMGLERVYAVDDHTADDIQARAGEGFDPAIMEIWSHIKRTADPVADRIKQGAGTEDDMLSVYRQDNDFSQILPKLEGDFGASLKHESDALYGRQYVAWWETRNLRMVANIRSAFANQPGAKVLTIVGSSHKPYFDSYLNMMHDVELVDASEILK